VEGLLTQPYVSVAEFRTAPTWLDSQDLVPGGNQGAQDDELSNVLLRASAWADNYCELRLGAHTVVEQTRARPDRDGLLYLTPSNFPVRSVTALGYGCSPQDMTLLPSLSQTWVEDSRGIVISLLPFSAQFIGSLQFGPVPRPDAELFIQYSYVAGYANTTLASPATGGASSITVKDATGFMAPATGIIGTLAGSTARIWEPGVEEAVTVASGYTAGNTTIPLTSPLANAHTAGAVVSEFPAEVRQAIISYAVALLMREDVTGDEPWPGTPFGPSARMSKEGGKAGGLLEHAWSLLEKYKRVR
jgi:hypothetical protein